MSRLSFFFGKVKTLNTECVGHNAASAWPARYKAGRKSALVEFFRAIHLGTEAVITRDYHAINAAVSKSAVQSPKTAIETP
jgi:hypothetical protein